MIELGYNHRITKESINREINSKIHTIGIVNLFSGVTEHCSRKNISKPSEQNESQSTGSFRNLNILYEKTIFSWSIVDMCLLYKIFIVQTLIILRIIQH